jgi:hypothetical protein
MLETQKSPPASKAAMPSSSALPQAVRALGDGGFLPTAFPTTQQTQLQCSAT